MLETLDAVVTCAVTVFDGTVAIPVCLRREKCDQRRFPGSLPTNRLNSSSDMAEKSLPSRFLENDGIKYFKDEEDNIFYTI